MTRRALNLFLDGNPNLAGSPDALITALNYVIPQINRTPNVCGFSPIQWTLGYTPHIPGLLMEEQTMRDGHPCSPSFSPTSVRRGGPTPVPQADRQLHYHWTGTTSFTVDVDNMSEGYAPKSDHEGGGFEAPDEEPPATATGPSSASALQQLVNNEMIKFLQKNHQLFRPPRA